MFPKKLCYSAICLVVVVVQCARDRFNLGPPRLNFKYYYFTLKKTFTIIMVLNRYAHLLLPLKTYQGTDEVTLT